MNQIRTLLSPSRAVAAVLLAGAATSLAVANVSVSQWTSATNFQHKRVGMPDMDQRRAGLPNDGNCYCAPTSFVNLAIYIANHGYPQVEPGPGNYIGYDHYADVTNLLEVLGEEASISPGGADPDDPDCNDSEGSGGGDGECSNLGCGGSVKAVYDAYVTFDYFGAAFDDLVFTARSLDANAPVASHSAFAQLAFDGAVIELCYGRYEVIGFWNGIPAWKRKGGHCVTMNEIFRNGSDRTVSVRDPAQDDGDVFGPSPFVTKTYDITDVTLLTTSDPDEGPIVNVGFKILPAIDEPQEDGKHRLLDGYFAISPKTGSFWKDSNFVKKLPLSSGFGGYVPSHQTTPPPIAYPIVDLVYDENGVGWIALAGGTEVSPPRLVKIDPVASTTTVLADLTALQLAINRFNDVYTLRTSPPVVERRDSNGVLKGTASIAGVPRAIACDDKKDFVYVVVPGTSGFGGTIRRYPRSLGLDGAPVSVFTIAPTVQIGTNLRAAVNPIDQRLWISSETTDNARAFSLPSVPGGPVAPVESVGGFAALTGIEFDDSGRLYAVDGGEVKEFKKDPIRDWIILKSSQFAGIDVGSMVRIAKSRSNFDPIQHATPGWLNIDTNDLEDLGTNTPDCIGDLNGDGVVDGADLAIILGSWGGVGIADIDENGVVDGADLAAVLGAWGAC
ncbi:MAG: hypothetical protein SGJ09_02660 [Phycisphaerae bacterium]|nr:hypothetical protein [Phycisphaerae bacterium]